MIRVFYNTHTGQILQTITYLNVEQFPTESTPFIDVDNSFNIDHYKVNLSSLTIEQLPESEWPKVSTRR